MRIDKFLNNTGYGSRKEVKALLKAGYVTVNDQLLRKADIHIDPHNDIIEVDNQVVLYSEKYYIMMNKPSGYLSATKDLYQPTFIDLMPEFAHLDLFCAGRLDIDTTGLLLITNDGQLVHNIISPKKKINKTYHALIDSHITKEIINAFEQGIDLGDFTSKPGTLELIESYETSELVQVVISEGKFHQVKRMFQAFDIKVLELKRISIHSLILDEDLEEGQYRFLNNYELESFGVV